MPGANEDSLMQGIGLRLAQALGFAQKTWRTLPFTYNINFLPAIASGNTTGQFLVQNDSAFCIVQTVQYVTADTGALAATVQPYGSGFDALTPFLIVMNDGGSGRNFSDLPVPIDSCFGSGTRPFIWPCPYILDPSTSWQVTLTNTSATARFVRLAFHGYKVFGNITAYLNTFKYGS